MYSVEMTTDFIMGLIKSIITFTAPVTIILYLAARKAKIDDATMRKAFIVALDTVAFFCMGFSCMAASTPLQIFGEHPGPLCVFVFLLFFSWVFLPIHLIKHVYDTTWEKSLNAMIFSFGAIFVFILIVSLVVFSSL